MSMSVFGTYLLYFTVFIASGLLLLLFKKTYNYRFTLRSVEITWLFRGILLVVAGIFPILLATFRYDTGTDFFSFLPEYRWSLKNINSLAMLQRGMFGYNDEAGLLLLMKISGEIFHSFQGFLFLASCLTVIPALCAFYIYDKECVDLCFFLYLILLFHGVS